MKVSYFAELSRILDKEGIKTAPIERDCLPIMLDGQPVGRVEPGGTMCLDPDDIRTPEASDLYFQAAPIVDMVQEYMTAMETAPPLRADSLDEEFKLLAEFNGTVLAGREMERGCGMKFVTWDWSHGKTGLYQGHYHMDSYIDAKSDFAVRAGLTQKRRQFTDEQLVEMYHCMSDTLDSDYGLTVQQEKLIENTKQQIESAVPNLQERIAHTQDMQMEPNQNM